MLLMKWMKKGPRFYYSSCESTDFIALYRFSIPVGRGQCTFKTLPVSYTAVSSSSRRENHSAQNKLYRRWHVPDKDRYEAPWLRVYVDELRAGNLFHFQRNQHFHSNSDSAKCREWIISHPCGAKTGWIYAGKSEECITINPFISRTLLRMP